MIVMTFKNKSLWRIRDGNEWMSEISTQQDAYLITINTNQQLKLNDIN
jgi:hypothetical protein